ncbi:MAG: rRNA maturation RNase YbeY [Chloroflexi bacterium]|nr:rRNA maturation RNase YbeY [Chloroflexota bacterium]
MSADDDRYANPGHPGCGVTASGESSEVARVYRAPWRIDVTVRQGVPRIVPRTELARVVVGALVAAEAPAPGAVGLILTDDAELTELNELAMGRREPTDVLSFPLFPPSAFPVHEGQHPSVRPAHAGPAFITPRGRRAELGEIAVSVERAIEQARAGRAGQTGDVRWSEVDELRLLVVHGTLHLCGWDHALPEEGSAMRALENSVLGRRWERALG